MLRNCHICTPYLKMEDQLTKVLSGMKATFIVLVPKKDGARELSEYRPISSMCSLYKIISKVLSTRLKKVIGMIVSSTQSAFISGLQITDGVLIANKCVDSQRRIGKK